MSSLLAAAVLGVSGAVLGPVAPLAHAATATDAAAEVVIPGATSATPVWNSVLSAGPHGYLHSERGLGATWRTYGGAEKPVTVDPDNKWFWWSYMYGTGSDVVARYDAATRVFTLKDMVTGESGSVTLPKDYDPVGVFGWNVLAANTMWGARELHVLDTRTGELRDRLVDGVLESPYGVRTTAPRLGDADGVLMGYYGHVYWVDTTQARATVLDGIPAGLSAYDFALTPERLLVRNGTELFVYDRADFAKAPLKVPVTDEKGSRVLGLVGDDVVIARHDPALGILDDHIASLRVEAVPLSGGTPRVLLARSTGNAIGTPDGGLLVDGGPSTADYGVQRVTADATGRAQAVRDSVVASPEVPNTVHRLTFEQGRLTSVEGVAVSGRTGVYTRPVTATGGATPSLGYGGRQDRGLIPTDLPDRCQVAYGCPAIDETGDGRLLYGGHNIYNDVVPLRSVKEGAQLPGDAIDAGTGLQKFVAGSGRWAVVGATLPGWTPENRVIDTDTGKVVRKLPADPVSLDGTTLWTRDGSDLTGYDIRSGASLNSAYIPSCSLENAEVVGRWLRWSCLNRGLGVYDLQTRTSTPLGLDFDARSELGDGFLAYVSGNRLLVRELATGAVHDTGAEGITGSTQWTVDPATGTIAWADAQGAIHLVGSGVPTSPLKVTDSTATTSANLKSGTWQPRWWLSKPAASWTLTLKRKATGAVVRTLSGAEARGVLRTVWDGKDGSGRLVPNGAYTWTLSAKPADGHGPDLTTSGSLSLTGAAAVWRDLGGEDGFGDLLVMDGAGLVSLYKGTGTGGLTARVAGTGAKFPTTSVFVPVGDVNGDRCADVLVRVGNDLRAYRPACGTVLSASSPYTTIGSGWGGYDVLTSPGDVNGDGYVDLYARQASTGEFYFYAGTADHRLKPRLKVGTGWKIYSKIIGAGDLNADGRGDLVAMDGAGVLWRYYGTATGGLTPRVKVGGGWGVYTSLVGVGDLTGDARTDLIARDTSGRLWRYSGLGNGQYAPRVLIGTGGWSVFKGLY